jgi:signal transduction histidine kinase
VAAPDHRPVLTDAWLARRPAEPIGSRHDPYPWVTAALRLAVLVLALGLATLRSNFLPVLPWVALLALPEAVVRGRHMSSRAMMALASWWAAVASVGVVLSGGANSALLTGLVVASFVAGLCCGARAVVIVNGLASSVLTVGWLLWHAHLGSSRPYFAALSQWVVLGLAIGLVGHRVSRPSPEWGAEVNQRYAEARALLQQLRDVTSRLPGSLDVTTTAEVLLESCVTASGATKGAVLLHVGDGSLVPAAVFGMRRVPWRSPLAGAGPLQQAWTSGEWVLDVRRPDLGGNRRGSALLVGPIPSPDGQLGLVALEHREPGGFDDAPLDELRRLVRRSAIQVETAQLFEAVRSHVTMEERTRLAKDMHDGVAQDLAFVGLELDALRVRAGKVDPSFAAVVADARGHVTRTISEIRASISDLRSSGSVERGLGSALTSYVRNVGTTGRMAVHLSLQENAFRLSAEVEVLVFKLAQALAESARDHVRADNLWVNLVVDPPAVSLSMAHDGGGSFDLTEDHPTVAQLITLGGSFRVVPRKPTGYLAELVIGGSGDDPTVAR